MTLLAVFAIFPFVWSFLGSFKSTEDLFSFAITDFRTYLPSVWRMENYRQIIDFGFVRYLANSLIVTVTIVIAQVILATTAGYAFARLEFPRRDLLFALVLATMMIPFQVIVVPLFILVKNFPLFGGNDLLGRGGTGMLDSYPGLTVPMFASAYAIFLLRQFFQTLPRELEDAARIDGASEFRIFWQIVLPLSKPGLAVLVAFSYQQYWNDFIWPFVVTRSDAVKTIQVGLANFQQEHGTDWGLLLAATMAASIPVILLYLALQRFFTRGIALSAIKG